MNRKERKRKRRTEMFFEISSNSSQIFSSLFHVISSVNIFGGFLITKRMLHMLRPPADGRELGALFSAASSSPPPWPRRLCFAWRTCSLKENTNNSLLLHNHHNTISHLLSIYLLLPMNQIDFRGKKKNNNIQRK